MPEEHHGGGKSGLEEFLNEDVGGIPAWVLGLGLGGLVLVFLFLRGRNTAAASTASASPAAGNSPQSTVQIIRETSRSPEGVVGLPPQGLPGPVTNTQWARLSADFLLSKGDDPTLVNNALFKFLHRQRLSEPEEAIVRLALRTFGEPPGGQIPVIGPGGSGQTGGNDVRVPAVEGAEADTARTRIEDAGLKPEFEPRPEGIVAFTNPGPGDRVSEGSTVTLHMAAAG